MNTQCPSILHHCHPSRNHFDPISLGCNPLLLPKKVPAQCTEAQLSFLRGQQLSHQELSKVWKQLPAAKNKQQTLFIYAGPLKWVFSCGSTSLWTSSVLQIFCQTHSCTLTHWNKTVFISIMNGSGQILTTAGYGRVVSLFISASSPFMVQFSLEKV